MANVEEEVEEKIVVKVLRFNGVKYLIDRLKNIYSYESYVHNNETSQLGRWDEETNQIILL